MVFLNGIGIIFSILNSFEINAHPERRIFLRTSRRPAETTSKVGEDGRAPTIKINHQYHQNQLTSNQLYGHCVVN